MAKRNQPTVMGYLSCIGENLNNLAKNPNSRQSLKEVMNCWDRLVNLLGIPGLCKVGQLPPRT